VKEEKEPGGAIVRVVGDDNSIVTRATSQNTTVTNMVLNIAHNSSLRD
jgi:hypothetical protein